MTDTIPEHTGDTNQEATGTENQELVTILKKKFKILLTDSKNECFQEGDEIKFQTLFLMLRNTHLCRTKLTTLILEILLPPMKIQ